MEVRSDVLVLSDETPWGVVFQRKSSWYGCFSFSQSHGAGRAKILETTCTLHKHIDGKVNKAPPMHKYNMRVFLENKKKYGFESRTQITKRHEFICMYKQTKTHRSKWSNKQYNNEKRKTIKKVVE